MSETSAAAMSGISARTTSAPGGPIPETPAEEAPARETEDAGRTAPAPITSLDGQSGLPKWFAASWSLAHDLPAGALEIALPDGRIFRAEGRKPGLTGRLTVRNPDLFARVAREGELGFSEAYLDGWWDSPDLQTLLDVLLSIDRWVERDHPAAGLIRAWRRINHWLKRNTKTQARRNIAAHYDLGNAFYSQWLDETMTYSSALFENPAEPLSAAQIRKYASVCDRLGLRPDARVLEIGCGWGGFAEYAAGVRGARVTGLTISREQHDFAKARMQKAGLSERVEIVLRDYRDERGSYDGLASIEMFEAVGEKYWPAYFAAVRDRLKPGASATIQVITVSDSLFPTYRKTVDFIQTYIFPGGMLPSPSALRDQMLKAGLTDGGTLAFGQSYSETLRRWLASFEAAWGDIQPLGFDDRFRRMWRFYLASCAAAFRSGATDVAQVTMRRPA